MTSPLGKRLAVVLACVLLLAVTPVVLLRPTRPPFMSAWMAVIRPVTARWTPLRPGAPNCAVQTIQKGIDLVDPERYGLRARRHLRAFCRSEPQQDGHNPGR